MHRFGVVAEGVLYRSGLQNETALAALADDYKLRTLVNLLQEDLASDRLVAMRHGMTYEWIPVETIPTPEAVDRFLAIMDDPKNYPVLVHCRAGLVRTGIMVALYRMEKEHWTADRAIAEARRFALWNKFEEGSDKTTFLKNYVLRFAWTPEKAAGRR
jgi:protein tyrosine/serine phosphatase